MYKIYEAEASSHIYAPLTLTGASRLTKLSRAELSSHSWCKTKVQIQAQCLIKIGPTIRYWESAQRGPINPSMVGPGLYLRRWQCRSRIPYNANTWKHPCTCTRSPWFHTRYCVQIIITTTHGVAVRRREHASMWYRHVEGWRRSTWRNIHPWRSSRRNHHRPRRSQQVRWRWEGGDHGISDKRSGGVSTCL